MLLQSDAVPGPMDERVSVPRLLDDAPGRPIHVLGEHPRTDRLERGLLGRSHHRVNLANFR